MHILLMAILLFEIITSYTLWARRKIMSKRYFTNVFKRPQIEHNTRQLVFGVFRREFPICDVAQGLIGDPLIFSKGNPPLWECYCTKKTIKCISPAKQPTIPYVSI